MDVERGMGRHEEQVYGTFKKSSIAPSSADCPSNGEATTPCPIFFSYRLLVTVICQLGITCSISSQSIVAASFLTMMRYNKDGVTALHLSNFTGRHQTSMLPTLGSEDEWHYSWDKRTQGWILSAYFVGYFIMQIPAAFLTHAYGGKRVAVVAAISLSMLQGLGVISARIGAWYFLSTMFLSGMANGCIYVPIADVLGKWVPSCESSVLVNMALSGNGLGVCLVYGLAAVTDHLKLWGGWPFNFLVLAGLLLLLAAMMVWLMSDTPAGNTYISDNERTYILTAQPSSDTHPSTEIPWKQLLTSRPVYAIAASQFGTDWILYFCITLFPVYLTHTRHIDTWKVNLLTALSWLLFPFSGYLASVVADRVRQRPHVSTTVVRKSLDACGKLVPMGLLLVLSHLPQGRDTENKDDLWPLVAGIYVLSVAFTSCEGSTWVANIVDLSARYSGLVSSISQVVSLPASFCLPLLFTALTPHNSEAEWQRCFLVSMVIVTISYLIYLCWGSSEPQHWGADTLALLSENEMGVTPEEVSVDSQTRHCSDRG